MSSRFSTRLLRWYASHGRALPWRGTRDPYRIWVSEIMLQQTQAETVIPYYRRWLRRFPSLRALARASQQEVLRQWEGLGYYARARNLHRAAQRVLRDHGGQLPRTPAGLRALPGIGAYTAAAIASIAFGVDAAVVDGNVKRVLARVFDYQTDVRSARGEKDMWALAGRLLPPGRAADYNQALMDLGAAVCTPRAPACPACPLRSLCLARRRGVQLERPVLPRRAPPPHHTLTAGVIRRLGRVLIVQRPADRLLGGMWAFPGDKRRGREALAHNLRRAVRDDLGLEIEVGAQRQTLTHAFTHFRVTVNVFDCVSKNGGPAQGGSGVAFRWVRPAALGNYPMGKTDRQIALHLQKQVQ